VELIVDPIGVGMFLKLYGYRRAEEWLRQSSAYAEAKLTI
jgi:hypothetical protein